MAPKGLSVEEKRKRILEIFKANHGEVYSLKEIEAIGGKRGIVVQTIKDVLQSLVDDNLVDTDKIGSGNFYWSLPSKEGSKKQARLKELKDTLTTSQNALLREKERTKTLKAARVDCAERTKNLEKFKKLKKKESEVKAELQEYADKDPVVLQQLQDDVLETNKRVNSWTSATASALELVSRETGRNVEEIKAHFQISEEDLEFVEG